MRAAGLAVAALLLSAVVLGGCQGASTEENMYLDAKSAPVNTNNADQVQRQGMPPEAANGMSGTPEAR